ncbi:PAAR domain-containing protein [Jannaschia rubra]|uniref:PAAR domain-containing protein n=1 Tax=Jannaschia rubra TaxID=282197 RepID=UPI003CD0CE1C
MPSIARFGDTHVCPSHGENAMVSGGTTMVDGRPVGRVGDETGCGAVIVEGDLARGGCHHRRARGRGSVHAVVVARLLRDRVHPGAEAAGPGSGDGRDEGP